MRIGRCIRVFASLALALLLGTFASSAHAQEFCSCNAEQFVWGGCAANGSCDPGRWAGCTPSPDDDYTIGADCHVELDGSDLLLAQPSPQGIVVKDLGSLSVRGPAELRLGPQGLIAEAGSRVELSGCFRRFQPAAGEDCAATLTSAAIFPIGRVIPCRNGECSDDAAIVRLDWALTDPSLYTTIDAMLDRIEVSRDVLCFWQNSVDGALGSDSGYCYKVTAVGREAGARTLDFDLRQVWSTQSNQAGYPLARREVQAVTLARDTPAGARTLAFLEPTLVDGRSGPAGRWLRCGGKQRGHLIASATDAASGDTLLLADSRGLDIAYGAGARCHVDWGWAEWDEAFVMAPLHVTAHAPLIDQTRLLLEGETTLRGVVIDGLGGQTGSLYGAALEIRGGPLIALEHVWVVDPLVSNTAVVLLDDLPCGTAVRHLTVSGGPADSEADKNYGLSWFGGSSCGYSVEHLYTRFMGDDNFVLESSGSAPTGAIDIHYAQAGPSSQPGDSGQLFDFGAPNPTVVSVRDALCTSCTSDDGRGALVAPSGGPGLIEKLLWVGTRNGGLVTSGANSNNWDFAFRQFGVIGSEVDPSTPSGAGPLPGLVADRFYVRDIDDPRLDSNRLCVGPTAAAQTRSLSHGIFSNVTLGTVPCEVSHATLSDLYFLDVSRGSPGTLLLAQSWASDVLLSRLTVAFTRPSSGLVFGVSSAFPTAPSELTIDGLLLTGFQGPDAVRAMNLASAQDAALVSWGAPTCFYDNAEDESPAVLAAYGATPVQGVDPHFVDPAAMRFDLAPDGPLAGVGCGARDAGYEEQDWAHRKTKLVPMYIDDPSAGYASIAALLPLLGLARRHARRIIRGSGGASRQGSCCPSGARAASETPRAPTARRD